MSDESASPAEKDDPAQQGVHEVIAFQESRRRKVLVAAVALLAITLVGVTYWVFALAQPAGQPTKRTEEQTGIEWVRSIYGWGSGPDQALVAPTDVAIAKDGTIWTLSGHRHIVAFNPDGTLKRIIEPKVGLSLEGITVGDDGIYVADYGGAIYRFDLSSGQLLTTWRVELPNEVHVRDGKIAVAAAKGIAVFTPDDEVIAKFGTRGDGADQFDLPHGIMLGDDGTIYVSDTHNRRVLAYTAAGRLKWTYGPGPRSKSADWRSSEASSVALELPAGMTMDGAGRLVLVDAFKFQMIVLDPKTGKLVRVAARNGRPGKRAAFGDYGGEDGAFMYPTGIDYDSKRDWFAVADTGNNRIQIVRIPESGGERMSRVRGAFQLPMLIFLLPVGLIVIAGVLRLVRARVTA